MTRQALEQFIETEFDVLPEHLWAAFPSYAVFRNPRNKKWFGLVGDVEKRKLGLEGEGKTELLVLRCDPILIGSLVHNPGYLPAYHMSRKNWLSVRLDGSAPPEQVKDLLHLAYEIIDKSK